MFKKDVSHSFEGDFAEFAQKQVCLMENRLIYLLLRKYVLLYVEGNTDVFA